MHRRFKQTCAWGLIVSVLLTGCQPMQPFYLNDDGDLSHYLDVATEIEYTDVGQESLEEVRHAQPPRTVANPQFHEFWDLTLEDATSIALQNSKVIRTYGQVRQFGQIVGGPPERLSAAPDSVSTVYDPAIQETGQSGVEQALSAFDAVFSSTATWDNTDRLQNVRPNNLNQAFEFQQDQIQFNNEVTKLSGNGSQWFFRNVSTFSTANNEDTRDTRSVRSDWFTALEAELRQPLLRNRGTQVNRIPIVLARIRTDLSLVDFEVSVRELLSSVERAYWELYFFYHNLRTAKTGRDSAWAAWQKVNALYQQGADGGEAEKEAQAREQYFRFRALLEDAQRDLFKSENRLRYLMGLSPTDDRLIRPADAPTAARVTFDWNLVHCEALARRAELRRQMWRIQQREMELIAARNQLLPQMDAVALYRWLGTGDSLISDRGVPTDSDGMATNYPRTAFNQLWGGDKQEYRLGFEANIPLGFRREMSQVRSSQLAVARERARLEDMELEIVHQLTDAIQDLDAGHRSLITQFSRRVAAEEQVEATEAAFEAGTVPLDLLLEAQRRQAEASINYYQTLVDYNNSIMTVHLRKGSLLEYDGVLLSEGPWPAKAYFDAVNRARQRDASHYLNYGYSRPRVISRGPVPGSGPESLGQPGSTTVVHPTEDRPTAAEPRELPSDADATQTLTDDLQRALDAVTGDRPGYESLPEPTPAQPVPPPDLPPAEIQPGSPPNDDLRLDEDLQLEPDLPPDSDLEALRPARRGQAAIRFSQRRPFATIVRRESEVAVSSREEPTVVRPGAVEIEWRN